MKTIYISYARGGESEAMADYVEKEDETVIIKYTEDWVLWM